MSGFKTLSAVNPTTRRPLRVGDLQDLWDGVANIFSGLKNDVVYIVSGFEIMDDGVTIDSGVAYHSGKLYKYTRSDSDTLTLGVMAYLVDSANAESRIFGDGTQQVFSYENIVTSVENPNSVDSFAVNEDTLRLYRVFGIPDGSITTVKLADKSVTQDKVADNAVSFAQQVTGSHSLESGLSPAANPLSLPYKNTFRTWSITSVDETNPVAAFTLVQAPPQELSGKVLKHEILIDNLSGESKAALVSVAYQNTTATYLVTVDNGQSKIVSIYVSCAVNISNIPTVRIYIGE